MNNVRITWNGGAAKLAAHEAGMRGLHDAGEAILTESQREVPHATGDLARSGTVTDASSEGAVYIGFSGPYAVRQHEENLQHPDPHNDLSTPGRKWKYLEDPFNRLKSFAISLAGQYISQSLGKR